MRRTRRCSRGAARGPTISRGSSPGRTCGRTGHPRPSSPRGRRRSAARASCPATRPPSTACCARSCSRRRFTRFSTRSTTVPNGCAFPSRAFSASPRTTDTRERPLRTPRFGAWLDDDGTHFRIWAPSTSRVSLLIDDRPPQAMARDSRGVHAADVPALLPGSRYRYSLDGNTPVPDPASRWQPDGVHGASAIDDPRAFAWRAAPVHIRPRDLVIYELHVGTFTAEGTFDAARAKLPYLRDLGVTAIELMPIAEFAGARNWGYDGAALFAPSSVYGGPHALRRFIDDAHAHGLAV